MSRARARAREAEKALKKVQRYAAGLETKLEVAEETSNEEDEEMPECAPTPKPLLELLPRRNENGRWQAESDEIRGAKWAQIARGVAPSTISANMADIFSLLGYEVPSSCPRTIITFLHRPRLLGSNERRKVSPTTSKPDSR